MMSSDTDVGNVVLLLLQEISSKYTFFTWIVSTAFAEGKCVPGVQKMGVLVTFGQKWCKLEKVSHRLSKASKEQLTETFTMPIAAYEKYIHHANSSSKWKFTLDAR